MSEGRIFPRACSSTSTDHLDGVLFLDRMKSFESLTFMEEFAKYWVKDDS